MRKLYLILAGFLVLTLPQCQNKTGNYLVNERAVFNEEGGILSVEAEYFYKQTHDDIRKWYITSKNSLPDVGPDDDLPHILESSNNVYLEILPDTRVTHDDKLIAGENFSGEAGKMGILYYKIYINTPGRYYVWARAYSIGSEDNGIHVGLNGEWPASGQRLQWCEGKETWRWESKQRTEKEHCGEPWKIYLDIENPGEHEIMFSMREDGFEFDKFILAKDTTFIPQGAGPAIQFFQGKLTASFQSNERLSFN